MTFWTWAKVKCPPSLSSDDDVEAFLALHRALRSSSTARVANVSRGSLCLRAPARSLASQKSARTARSSHCRRSRTTATPVTTEPYTSSRHRSQKKGWAPAQARSAALSRVYPYSPSSTGSRTSAACHPPSPVSHAHTYTLSSLPLSLCSMRAHQVSCDSGRHCPPSASSLLRECSLYLMSKTRTAMSSRA